MVKFFVLLLGITEDKGLRVATRLRLEGAGLHAADERYLVGVYGFCRRMREEAMRFIIVDSLLHFP